MSPQQPASTIFSPRPGDDVEVWLSGRREWRKGRVCSVPTATSHHYLVSVGDGDHDYPNGVPFPIFEMRPFEAIESIEIPVGRAPKMDAKEFQEKLAAVTNAGRRQQPLMVDAGPAPESRETDSIALARKLLDLIAPRVDGDTPKRFVHALLDLTSGYYGPNAKEILKTFPIGKADPGIVMVRDVPFASVCEHHVLPFSGHASIAYLPGDRIVGLSKIPRLVRHVTRKLQVQERIGAQIADAMMEHVGARGVMVVLRSQHSCMALRGVESPGSMVTSTVRGIFETDSSARAEALQLLK